MNLRPYSLGMNHFGALTGESLCEIFLEDALTHTINFRNAIMDAYEIEPKVRFIINKISKTYFEDRGMLHPGSRVALTYGMMIDLGLRTSKYEPRHVMD